MNDQFEAVQQQMDAEKKAYDRQRTAEKEIQAISAVAEWAVRDQPGISGADALLKAIDLVRSVRTAA